MTRCKALIFDLGKVVFDLSFDRVFQSWAAAAGRHAEELKDQFQFDELVEEFEKDKVSPAKFRAQVSKRLALRLTDQAFDAGWCDLYLATYPEIDNLLASLTQRYQLVALTNTNSIHSAVWPLKYAATLRYFQKVFCSHELKERKPAAQAYHIVLDYLQVKPAQVVFLDDNPANTSAAEQLGIKTILVTSYAQMVAELRALGIWR